MEYRAFIGEDVPMYLKSLTLPNGLMQYWFEDRKSLVAVVAYENDVHVGWCAYRHIHENIYDVSTFVLPEYRNVKLASKLLDAAMQKLAEQCSMAQVRYGGSSVLEFHETYIRTIKKHGLESVRWY